MSGTELAWMVAGVGVVGLLMLAAYRLGTMREPAPRVTVLHPGEAVVIETDRVLTMEQMDRIREQWKEAMRGPAVVLDKACKLTAVQRWRAP